MSRALCSTQKSLSARPDGDVRLSLPEGISFTNPGCDYRHLARFADRIVVSPARLASVGNTWHHTCNAKTLLQLIHFKSTAAVLLSDTTQAEDLPRFPATTPHQSRRVAGGRDAVIPLCRRAPTSCAIRPTTIPVPRICLLHFKRPSISKRRRVPIDCQPGLYRS